MDTSPLPPEVLRLTRREQKYAVPFYSKWMAIFMTDRPDKYDDNLKRALNGAYGTAARYWLGPTALFAIPASFILSVWRSLPGLILMCIAGLFFCVAIWRTIQALRFYPHLSMRRLRVTDRHPDLYE